MHPWEHERQLAEQLRRKNEREAFDRFKQAYVAIRRDEKDSARDRGGCGHVHDSEGCSRSERVGGDDVQDGD